MPLVASRRQGQFSLEVLIFSAVAVVLISGFVFLSLSFTQFAVRGINKQVAFSIAEAGVEYYRWHLAHAPSDFQDGTGQPGPYAHNYYDKNGVLIGQFILDITPPPTGSTVVKIRSTGKVTADSTIQKIVEVKLAIASFAKYAVAANAAMRFGAGTEVFGEIMSNGGIRFDGVAHNFVKSAVQSYTDTDFDACTGTNSWGVHTCSNPDDPLWPAALPDRPDIFNLGRESGVPAVNFAGITQDLADLKDQASSSGAYFPSSTYPGYELVLKTNDTYDVYRVNSLIAAPSGCTNSQNQSGWGTWTVNTSTLIASGTIPANGIFFFEHNAWVKGSIDGARVTVASAHFPDNSTSSRTNITVNSNLTYTNYDGSDAIALIAQNNINIGLQASTTLRIDAALVAQNGRIGRYYYRPPGGGSQRCSPYHTRQEITSYGMIATSQRYGFAYTDGTGYQLRNLIYDTNLLYGPPPGFPLVGSQYIQVSWTEVQ